VTSWRRPCHVVDSSSSPGMVGAFTSSFIIVGAYAGRTVAFSTAWRDASTRLILTHLSAHFGRRWTLCRTASRRWDVVPNIRIARHARRAGDMTGRRTFPDAPTPSVPPPCAHPCPRIPPYSTTMAASMVPDRFVHSLDGPCLQPDTATFVAGRCRHTMGSILQPVTRCSTATNRALRYLVLPVALPHPTFRRR